MPRTIRAARPEDREDVAAFTGDTWDAAGVSDYLPDAFDRWMATDDDRARPVVAEVDGTVIGLCKATRCSDWEGWLSGMRVHPDHRGEGHARALTEALFEWCRDRSCAVVRNMVYDWNAAGMGQSRAVGFEPVTAVRVAQPETADNTPALDVREDSDAAWSYWTGSEAWRTQEGLAFDPRWGWALSELTLKRLRDTDSGEGTITVGGDEPVGMAARLEVRESYGDGGDVAWYAVAAWEGLAACEALFDAIRADGAELGVDEIRVPIPDTARHLSDASAARAEPSRDAMVIHEAALFD